MTNAYFLNCVCEWSPIVQLLPSMKKEGRAKLCMYVWYVSCGARPQCNRHVLFWACARGWLELKCCVEVMPALHKLVGRPGGAFERLSSSSSTSVRHLTSCAWWLGFLIGVGVNAVTSSTKGKGACFQLQIVALMYMYRTMYIRRFLYKGPRGR